MMLVLLLFSLALVVTGLSTPFDLSHYYDTSTLYWPGGTPFHFTLVYSNNRTAWDGWYAANEFKTAEHGGTHLDAPYHFHKHRWQIGEIPLHRLIGKAVVVDLRTKASQDPDYLVTEDDFEEWERQHGLIPEGAIVLLDFGWTAKYNNHSEYFGNEDINDTSSFHFPGLSEEGANWLVETGKVYGVGTDTASIDYGQSKDFLAHRTLSESNVYILEHVAMPETLLPPSGYQIIALPMKLRHGTGAPCRLVALPFTKN